MCLDVFRTRIGGGILDWTADSRHTHTPIPLLPTMTSPFRLDGKVAIITVGPDLACRPLPC